MDEIKVYLKDRLSLKPSVPGAMMWAVGLDRAMLTYFEMGPNTKFPDHSHDAEQITMILEGELTFSYEGKTVTLRSGDVIAIPSNMRHAAFTGIKPCKAVDAWSPVRKEFFMNVAVECREGAVVLVYRRTEKSSNMNLNYRKNVLLRTGEIP